MKPLTEVIAILAEGIADVEAYDAIDDALYYLREYHDNYGNLIASMNHHLRKIKELEQNDPLTWNELKEMVGKPVWMETPEWSEWMLLNYIDQDKSELYFRDKWGNGFSCNIRNHLTWHAYPKEREC